MDGKSYIIFKNVPAPTVISYKKKKKKRNLRVIKMKDEESKDLVLFLHSVKIRTGSRKFSPVTLAERL